EVTVLVAVTPIGRSPSNAVRQPAKGKETSTDAAPVRISRRFQGRPGLAPSPHHCDKFPASPCPASPHIRPARIRRKIRGGIPPRRASGTPPLIGSLLITISCWKNLRPVSFCQLPRSNPYAPDGPTSRTPMG